jgi:two-component system response regulator YesN
MHRNLSKRYFFTIYLLCSFFLIIAILITHQIGSEVLIEQIHLNNLARLEQASAAFDALHQSTIPSMVQLLENSQIQRLIYSSQQNNNQLVSQMQMLTQAKLSNPIIESILAYNKQLDRVFITDVGSLSVAELNNPELIDLFDRATGNDLYRYFPRVQDGKALLTILVGYHPVDQVGLAGGLLININERTLRNVYLRDFSEQAGKVTIVDPQGIIITDPNQDYFGQFVQEDSFIHPSQLPLAPSGTFLAHAQDQRVLVSYKRHETMDWYFFLVSPYEVQSKTLTNTRNTILLILITLLSALFAGAWILSHRLAKPVEKLVDTSHRINKQLLKQQNTLELPTQSQDTVSFVDSMLLVMEQKITELNTFYESYSSLQENELFHTLIEGHIPDDYDLQVPWISDHRRYCIITLKGFEFPAQEKQPITDFMEVLSKGLPGVVVSTLVREDIFVLLWDCDLGDFDQIPYFIDQLALDSSFIPSKLVYGISTIASIQDEPLSALYNQALSALSLQFRGTGQQFYRYDELVLPQKPYVYPEKLITRILNAIKSEHPETAGQLLNHALEDVTAYTYEDFSFFVQNFLYDIHKDLVPTGFLNPPTILQIQRFRKEMNWFTTVADVHKTVTEIFSEYTQNRNCTSDSRRSEIIQSIQELIHADYLNPNLSPKSIADSLNLSVNYVRRIFKEQHKKSISDYITKTRIAYCSQLLQTTDLSIKDIYQKAGFISYNYFFDTFKKSTGFTPGEYRNRHTHNPISEFVQDL